MDAALHKVNILDFFGDKFLQTFGINNEESTLQHQAKPL